jgi:FkbM family methyltransferase
MRLGKYVREPALLIHKARWWMVHAAPRRDVTVESYNGLLTFDSRDRLIGKYLYVHRSYEAAVMESALALLRRDGLLAPGAGTVVDVGANIGMICIALLAHGHFQRALAIEPAPGNLRLLRRNIVQNRLADRITVLPCALSSASGEMELELSDYNSGDHRLRHAVARGAFREVARPTITVQVRTLDSVLRDAGVDPGDVRLLWADIQGHEAQCFEGARQLLQRGVPVVSEFWPYGILRSGISRPEYVKILTTLFSHFYLLRAASSSRHQIGDIDALFDQYARPKQMCQIVLVRTP